MTTLPQETLTARTLRGAGWATAGNLAGAVLQLLYTMVMARLLSPWEFGLVAMANVVVGFSSHLSRLGLGQALIQRTDLSLASIGTTTALSWAAASGAALLVMLVAPLAGAFYGQPLVAPVLATLAFPLALNGAGMVPEALLRRDLRFRRLAGIEFGSYAVGYLGFGVTSALAGAGVWSLVAAAVCQSLLKNLALLASDRRAFRPRWNRIEARSITRFGSGVTIIGLVQYTLMSVPEVVIGRMLGTGPLGHFNRGQLLVVLPFERLIGGVARVFYPSLASLQKDPGRFVRGYEVALGSAGAVLVPLGIGVAVAAEPLVTTVLGPKWSETVPILPALAIAGIMGYLLYFPGVALEALGRLRGKLAVETCALLVLAIVVPLAARRGLPAVSWVLAGVQVLRFAATASLLRVALGPSLGPIARPLVPATLLGVSAGAGTVVAFVLLPEDMGPLLRLAVIAASGATGVALAQPLGPVRRLRNEVLSRFRQLGSTSSTAPERERLAPDYGTRDS